MLIKIIQEPCISRKYDFRESETYKTDLKIMQAEFEKTNAERYLEEPKRWNLPGKKRRSQRNSDDSLGSFSGASLWKRQSSWALPCLKQCDSLWLSDQHLKAGFQIRIFF